MTQVEFLAKYAARASFADLSAQSRKQLPVHILDSIGCCIAALGAGPVEACRAQVADFGSDGPCALIGGGKANPIYAAFWHTALVRYVDFMDNFLAATETCHTADNFGVALTVTDYVGGSGRDLMLAVALSYTVQSRFVDHANFMTRGFDHTTQLAFSLNAAAGRLLGMSERQIANAIAMAAVSDAYGDVRYGFVLAGGFASLLMLGLVFNWLANPAGRRLQHLDQAEYGSVCD